MIVLPSVPYARVDRHPASPVPFELVFGLHRQGSELAGDASVDGLRYPGNLHRY